MDDKHKIAIKHFKRAIQISHASGLATEIGEMALLGTSLSDRMAMSVPRLKPHLVLLRMHRELSFPVIDDHPSQNIWWRHMLALTSEWKK